MKQPFPICLACAIFLISPLPWLLFLQGARDEPFNGFAARHAIMYLGFGSALLVVLCLCSLGSAHSRDGNVEALGLVVGRLALVVYPGIPVVRFGERLGGRCVAR